MNEKSRDQKTEFLFNLALAKMLDTGMSEDEIEKTLLNSLKKSILETKAPKNQAELKKLMSAKRFKDLDLWKKEFES